MTIVEAGARRDLGQLDAALRTLELAPLMSKSRPPWVVRLRYAYADTLEAAGREGRPLAWFHRAVAIDGDELTDAAERADVLEKRRARACLTRPGLTRRPSTAPDRERIGMLPFSGAGVSDVGRVHADDGTSRPSGPTWRWLPTRCGGAAGGRLPRRPRRTSSPRRRWRGSVTSRSAIPATRIETAHASLRHGVSATRPGRDGHHADRGGHRRQPGRARARR